MTIQQNNDEGSRPTNEKENDSEESVSPGETTPDDETSDFQKVLTGIDSVKPLTDKDNSQFGYSSKIVSTWYRHKCDYDSCPKRWAEFSNVDDEEADLVARTRNVPILHRHANVNNHWVTSSITIQDSSMQQILRNALTKYQDLDLDLINYTFEPPFMPLVHRWEELKAQYIDQKSGPLKNAAAILLAFLAPIIAPSILSYAQTKKTGKVSFENVWQVFPPSSIVKTKFYGVDTICRVVKYKKRAEDRCNPAGWVIDMEYVDWNGETSGWTTTTMTIWEYEGHKKVVGLPVFPVSFLPDADAVKMKHMERGRKWAQLRGYNLAVANGTKILLETEKPEQRPVSGKVCIDAYAYYRSCNIVKPSLRPVAAAAPEEDSDEEPDESDALSSDGFESKFAVAQVDSGSQAKGPAERSEEISQLTNEELLMTTPWMKGFDLKSKTFCELNINDLKDITWNDEAFDKLVLPGGEKELAWAFVENKSHSKSDFDDFVADKGKGLIILMFGPPGVGKTFTAEAVAERSRVPLYSMSAGDLGTKPSEVEKALERALELCRMWNAMLLLDEADVFLGERTNESLARNELVSIFLTKLEYYQGILFLTTNRITSIDHAFQSRVDLFLPYRDLTSEARRQVWNNFITRAGRDKFTLTETSLNELSELKLNGREIKNLIKSAQLLSLKDNGKVPVERLLLLAEKRVQALKELDGI